MHNESLGSPTSVPVGTERRRRAGGRRLLLGTGAALAASLIAACGAPGPSGSTSPSPSAQTSSGAPASEPLTTTPPPPNQSRAAATQPPTPTPARKSLLAQIVANGTTTVLTLGPVVAGTSCAATARLQSGRSLAVSDPRQQVARSDGQLNYRLDDSHLPDNDTVVWTAACTLNGDSRTIPFTAATPRSSSTSPHGQPVPAKSGTAAPNG